MRPASTLVMALSVVWTMSCSGGKPDAASIAQAADGIPGWTRTGEVEIYNREGLYGYIDGGAEIVLPYGFLEVAVSRLKPAGGDKELVLEVYRMAAGEDAFGLYSTKLEGGETGWPGIAPDNWIGTGQASLVKGAFVVNIMAAECTDREIGEFAAAVERRIPGAGTVRPNGLGRLPRDGMIAASGRFIKGAVAAANESPFLEGECWGFGRTDAGGVSDTVAFTAKYGTAPGVSKLVLVEFAEVPPTASLEDAVMASFQYYLRDVRRAGGLIEGRNDVGRWFLFVSKGRTAVLVLGEPDGAAARSRLETALSR
jgi:hypothetical protein